MDHKMDCFNTMYLTCKISNICYFEEVVAVLVYFCFTLEFCALLLGFKKHCSLFIDCNSVTVFECVTVIKSIQYLVVKNGCILTFC